MLKLLSRFWLSALWLLTVTSFADVSVASPTLESRSVVAQADPLPSWRDTPTKRSILEFVKKVTDPHSKDYVSPAARVATFDNDGTIWVEQPLYPGVLFTFDQIRVLAAQHPEWQVTEPFRSVLSYDQEAIARFTPQDFDQILEAAHAGMTVDAYAEAVNHWFDSAKHPRFDRHYDQLIYQPMLELMAFLRQNQFKVFLVSGAEQDFLRVLAHRRYDMTPDQVIGTANTTQYAYQQGKPVLLRQSEIQVLDDKEGKAEAINLFIGQRPIFAFGNSNGDRQMLEWTDSNPLPHFVALVHHDDAKREYDYGARSKIGSFPEALMDQAQAHGWHVVSMKDDWGRIFP